MAKVLPSGHSDEEIKKMSDHTLVMSQYIHRILRNHNIYINDDHTNVANIHIFDYFITNHLSEDDYIQSIDLECYSVRVSLYKPIFKNNYGDDSCNINVYPIRNNYLPIEIYATMLMYDKYGKEMYDKYGNVMYDEYEHLMYGEHCHIYNKHLSKNNVNYTINARGYISIKISVEELYESDLLSIIRNIIRSLTDGMKEIQ